MEAGALIGRLDCRVITCERCGVEVMICRHCDRRQIYCGRECAKAARRATWRRSSARYQQTRRGKHNHAAREKRRRERGAQKVTQQGPPGEPELRVMESSLEEPARMPALVEAEAQRDAEPPALQQLSDVLEHHDVASEVRLGTLVRCAFCGGLCHFDGRTGPARRRGPASHQRRGPRLPRASRAPPSPG